MAKLVSVRERHTDATIGVNESETDTVSDQNARVDSNADPSSHPVTVKNYSGRKLPKPGEVAVGSDDVTKVHVSRLSEYSHYRQSGGKPKIPGVTSSASTGPKRPSTDGNTHTVDGAKNKSPVDQYGFEHADAEATGSYEQFMSGYLSVLARRASRWTHQYRDEKAINKSLTAKRFCRKGVPGDYRTKVWMRMSGAEAEMDANKLSEYKRLLEEHKDPTLLDIINMDIPRTFPENVYFAETGDIHSMRVPLQHVLTALAHKNQHTGYCQGLNFIAGMLLLIIRDEEKVFWLMDRLINSVLPGYYAPDMLSLRTEQEVLGELVRWKVPDVYEHMKTHGVEWSMIGMKWFICLYADVMPTETVLRIWDCLFYEGSKILFRVAVTLIILNKEAILKAKNFSKIVDVFKQIVKDPVTLQCHSFMQQVFKVPGSFPQSRITKLRTELREQVKAQDM